MSTTYAEAPYTKRVIQGLIVGMLWLVNAMVLASFMANPAVTGLVRVAILCIIFVWAPSTIAYAWFTAPSDATAGQAIVRSRVGLLYERYFGLNGEVGGARLLSRTSNHQN